MARPHKLTVEWFPHPVAHGKVVYVLEEAYGNDGYAFWFKLRETLGETSGHYIDCRSHGAWGHLLSKMDILTGKAEAIMGALANMDAIDQELWERCRVIWSEEYVRDLKPVYDRRKLQLPVRPASLLLHPIIDTRNQLLPGFSDPEPTGVELTGIEVVERGSRERDTTLYPSPEILRGLELYEEDELLLKNFTRNYNNWKKACPNIDVDQEIRTAHSWEVDNPKLQKPDKARFLGGWLRGEQKKAASGIGQKKPTGASPPPAKVSVPCDTCNGQGTRMFLQMRPDGKPTAPASRCDCANGDNWAGLPSVAEAEGLPGFVRWLARGEAEGEAVMAAAEAASSEHEE